MHKVEEMDRFIDEAFSSEKITVVNVEQLNLPQLIAKIVLAKNGGEQSSSQPAIVINDEDEIKIEDEIEREFTSQRPAEAESENQSTTQLPAEEETKREPISQRPAEAESKNQSSTQLEGTERESTSQRPAEVESETQSTTQLPAEEEAKTPQQHEPEDPPARTKLG